MDNFNTTTTITTTTTTTTTTIRTNTTTTNAAVAVASTTDAPNAILVSSAVTAAAAAAVASNSAFRNELRTASNSPCDTEAKADDSGGVQDCRDGSVLARDRLDCSNIMDIDITLTTANGNDPPAAVVAGSQNSIAEN